MTETRHSTSVIRLAVLGTPAQVGKLTAVVDRLPNRTVVSLELDDSLAIDGLFSSHKGDFDAIVAVSPSTSRLAITQTAMRHRKHVYVQSPVTLDPEAIGDLDRDFQSAGLVLMVGQPQRHQPSVLAVKAAIDSGKLGAPGLVRSHRWHTPGHVTTSGDEDAIRSMQVDFDRARWFFGAMPISVYATGSTDARYRQVHLGFPDGGMALFDYTSSLHGENDYVSFSVIAATGAAYADDHHNQQLHFHGNGPPTALVTGQGDLALVNSLNEFVGHISGGTTADNTLERDAMLITAAAELSLAHQRVVQWKEGHYELA